MFSRNWEVSLVNIRPGVRLDSLVKNPNNFEECKVGQINKNVVDWVPWGKSFMIFRKRHLAK